jgi:hypothetical protein
MLLGMLITTGSLMNMLPKFLVSIDFFDNKSLDLAIIG